MKCEICGNKLDQTFLKKMVGTIIKDHKGKKHTVCCDCQREKKNDKASILKVLNKE